MVLKKREFTPESGSVDTYAIEWFALKPNWFPDVHKINTLHIYLTRLTQIPWTKNFILPQAYSYFCQTIYHICFFTNAIIFVSIKPCGK